MSDPTQQPPSDPYRPQDPYQPQAPYEGPQAPGGQAPPPQGPPQYGHNPYGAGPGGPYQPYGQPPFGRPPVQNHPQATTSLVLGAVGVGSIFVLCGLLLFVSPVAWIMGSKAIKEIDASNGAIGGRSEALWGKIMGIIGTVLLVLGIIAIIVLVVIIVNESGSDGDYSYNALIDLVQAAR